MNKIKSFLKSKGINRDTVERAVSTFIQAVLAYILTVLAAGDYFAEGFTKKAVIGLVLSAVAAGLSAVKNAIKNKPVEQRGAGSSMTLADFIKKHLGKKTDWDGVYGVQCVDLIDAYIEKVLELKIGFFGNAKTWWTDRNKSAWLKANFNFITPKYKNGELKPGDIGIRTSGTWGHIFIVAEEAKNGKIKYYDQNADGKGAAMTLREKPYTSDYINGILRPKKQSNIGAVKATDTSTSSVPTFKVGSTYTLTTNVKVRTGAGTSYSQKKRSQLTADGKANSVVGVYAVLKKNTKFTVQEIKNVGSDIWAKIPSGWICLYYKGDKYAK